MKEQKPMKILTEYYFAINVGVLLQMYNKYQFLTSFVYLRMIEYSKSKIVIGVVENTNFFVCVNRPCQTRQGLVEK